MFHPCRAAISLTDSHIFVESVTDPSYPDKVTAGQESHTWFPGSAGTGKGGIFHPRLRYSDAGIQVDDPLFSQHILQGFVEPASQSLAFD